MSNGHVDIMDEILGSPIPSEEEGVNVQGAQPPPNFAHVPERAQFSGALVGSMIPPGNLNPATRAAQVGGGAGVMYMAGKTAQDLANNVPQSLDQIGHNLIEATKEGLTAFSAEAAFPGAGVIASAKAGGLSVRGAAEYMIGKVAKKVGEYVLPMKGTVVAATERILGKQGGAGLTPGQMDPRESSLTKTFENIAYHSWTGGPIKGAYQANERDLGQAVDQFAGMMEQLSPKDAEATFKAVIDGRIRDYWMRPADKAFDSIRQRAPGRVIEATPLLKTLRDPNSKIGNLVVDGLKKIREFKPDQTAEIDELISLLETPAKGTQTQTLPRLTTNQAMYLKTALTRIQNRTTYGGTPEGDILLSAAGRMGKQLDGQIEAGLNRVMELSNDTKLLNDYQKANKFYAAAAEKYDNDLIRRVFDTIEKKPGSLARVLLPDNIPSEQEHLNLIKAAKAAYGPRWNIEMIPLLSASLANRAYRPIEQVYDGKQFAAQLDKYGVTLLDTMLGPKRGQQLMDFARALELVGQRPKGVGSMMIQMATAGALVGTADYMIQGDVEKALGKGAATVLIAPWMLGHLLGNPKWLGAMKTGLFEFSKTGKPPREMMTVLRQAAIASQAGTVAQRLEVEPDKSKPISETRLPRGLTPTLSTEAAPR